MRRWIVVLLLAAPVGAVPPLPRDRVEAIAARVSDYATTSGAPAVSVAVQSPDGFAALAVGQADVGANLPATVETRFRLASISKTLTAVLLMQAVRDRRLRLDDDVRRWVPQFPAKAWPFTVRQLGGHLAGIRHYAAGDAAKQHPCERIAEGLDIFWDDPLLHQPGTKYQYGSYGFNLLGCVAESALREEYVEACRRRLFAPVGGRSFAVWRPGIDRGARGYALVGDRPVLSEPADTTYKIPGGGWCASATDVCRFAIGVADGTLLDEKHRLIMWTGQQTTDGTATNYGIGWGTRTVNGVLEVSHSGGQEGCATYLYVRPGQGTAAVVLTNLAGAPGLGNLARELAKLAEAAPVPAV